MKRVLLIAILIMLGLSNQLFSQEFDPLQGNNIQLGIKFGFGYAPNSDMNDPVKDFGDALAAEMNAFTIAYYAINPAFENNTSDANWNYGFDFEPRYFVSNMGIGLSVGYHSTSSAQANVESDKYTDTFKISLQLKCYPLLASLYYKGNISDSMFFLVGAGGGYYIGTMEYDFEDNFSLSATYGESETIKYKGNAIGAHARFEVDYVYSMFAFYGGVEGRYVKFDEFKKSGETLKSSDGSAISAQLTGVYFYFGASVLL